ncbi:hypothetical protein Syun_022653 [Stephania yunnanensis]|uniref:ENTH domain-containing protein n=1 Tax=Stephania yunnanensis TaxID=152371 RepID=A0AAP0FA31_9MAGN
MKLWRRAAGVVKDTNSICRAKLAKRSTYRQPELETALIKATSHDEFYVDYKNAQRVFATIRASSVFLKPLMLALTKRVERTRSWVVVLKCLMLIHGALCCKAPSVLRMFHGLPFDLSSFKDGHSYNSHRTWSICSFVRAYFAYLDRRLAFDASTKRKFSALTTMGPKKEIRPADLLEELQGLQSLLDLLMQIRPEEEMRNGVLIHEAMDCTLVEIFDVYSRICNGIAAVLMRIYGATKAEATTALSVLHKASLQGAQLALYFDFCRGIGILRASELPVVEQIPEEDIQDLERIIKGVSTKTKTSSVSSPKKIKAIELKEQSSYIEDWTDPEKNSLQTVVSNDWVAFDDEFQVAGGIKGLSSSYVKGETNYINPFEDIQRFPSMYPCGYNGKSPIDLQVDSWVSFN